MNMKLKIPSTAELTNAVLHVQEALKDKREALQEAAKIKTWLTSEGTFSPNEAAEVHEGWGEAQIPFSWAPTDGSRTFYHRIQLPADYMGISLLESEVSLELFWAIGAEVFVNGIKLYGVDYWADTQVVPISLTPKVTGPNTFEIVAQCRQGDGFGLFVSSEIRISALDEWIFKLDTFAEELGFVQFLVENGDATDVRSIQILYDIVKAFDIDELNNNRWSSVRAMIEETHRKLHFFEPLAKKYTVYLVGHAHIDMNWLWPWSETEDLIRRDFESMDSIMEEFPQVCFSHSQAATYKAMQDKYPELWNRIKKRIEQGRWDVTASTWVEGDLNMAGYETLARQLLQGKSYVRNEFGIDPEICWEPDTFGHPATMPQVLSKSGIKYYYHCRAGKGAPLFWWDGSDGSRILVFNDPRGYNGRIFASHIVAGSKEMARQYGLKCNMYVFGIGDHGGGVTRQDVRRAIRLNESPLLPNFQFAKTIDFYRMAEQACKAIPIIKGELNTVFEGCYTSHGDIKKANRETEHALVQSETMASIAASYILYNGGGIAADSAVSGLDSASSLRGAWRRLCFNQFHDILCGCAIHQTYAEAVPAAAEAKRTADWYYDKALQLIVQSGGKKQTASSSTITVTNTLSWERTDIVTLKASDYPEISGWQTGDELYDASGERTVIQRLDDEIVFVAKKVPAFGLKTYAYTSSAAAANKQENITFSSMGNPVMNNGRFKIEIDRESGTIVSLIDQATDRELSYTPQGQWVEANQTKGLLNLFEVQYEAPHTMSAWKLGTIAQTMRLVSGAEVTAGQQGPVMQSLHIKHSFEHSTIRQEIRVYWGLDRIDFMTTVDWGERGSGKFNAPMLRVLFTPKIEAADHTFDIPFGALKRNPDGREVPAVHWIDVSEADAHKSYGMTLINNAKYGHSIQGYAMAVTLIRSSYEPDNSPDVGHHEFTYAIYPHEKGWREAQSDRKGWELNQPLRAALGEITGSDPYSPLQIEEFTPSGWSEASGITVTAFKPSEHKESGGYAWVIRMVEMHGRKTRLRLKTCIPLELVEEVNLLEDQVRTLANVNEGVIDIGELNPNEIRTYRISITGTGG